MIFYTVSTREMFLINVTELDGFHNLSRQCKELSLSVNKLTFVVCFM
jgi:hypothetical protein